VACFEGERNLKLAVCHWKKVLSEVGTDLEILILQVWFQDYLKDLGTDKECIGQVQIHILQYSNQT
jgi:hypothetical protein